MRYNRLYIYVAILGGMLFGYDTAIINGAMPFFSMYFQLTDTELGWAISSGLLGCIIGSLIASWPAELLGRKATMLISSVLFFFSSVGTGLAHTLDLFVLSRIIGGVAVGLVSVTLPIYISEVSTPEKRGSLTVNFQLGVVIGILVAFFIDFLLINTGENNWRYMFASMMLPSIFFGICLMFIHRSPRWLIKKKRNTEAKLILEKIYSQEQANAVYEEMISLIKDEKNELRYIDIFRKTYLKFIFIGVAVGVFSQLSGIAIVMYYATDIFRSAGFSTNSALGQTVILGFTNLFFTLLAKRLIDRWGRRKLLLVGTIMMVVFLSLLSVVYLDNTLPSWCSLLALVGFVASFASSMGAVSWVLLSEIFPNRIRSIGMSIGSLVNWIVNGCISFLFPIIAGMGNNGRGICFAFFAVMTFIGFLFFKKYLFETCNKSLEEIETENI